MPSIGVTLKLGFWVVQGHYRWSWLGVVEGHWKWHHSIDRIRVAIRHLHCNYMAVSPTVFGIKRNIDRKTPIFHTPLYLHDPLEPLRIFPEILIQTAQFPEGAKYCRKVLPSQQGERTLQTDGQKSSLWQVLLQTVYRAVIIAKLLYASSACRGFATAYLTLIDIQHFGGLSSSCSGFWNLSLRKTYSHSTGWWQPVSYHQLSATLFSIWWN